MMPIAPGLRHRVGSLNTLLHPSSVFRTGMYFQLKLIGNPFDVHAVAGEPSVFKSLARILGIVPG